MSADHAQILETSEVRFGYRISVLANWYRGPGVKEIERKYGLTEPECGALFCIGHSEGLTATDVCHITGRPKNSISRAIQILRQKKLLTRRVDPGDARRRILCLTDAGRQLYGRIVPVFLATERSILEGLTPSELSNLDRLLTKMIVHITSTAKDY